MRLRCTGSVAAADLQPVYGAAAMIVDAFRGGGKLLVLGNGGSAADAQHVAAELVGRFERVRRPLAAIALTADTSVMTSVANDEGYARGVRPAGRSAGPFRRCRSGHQHQRSIAERRRRL